MADKAIKFKYDPDKTLRLFPDERYDLSLSTWVANAKVANQRAEPDKGLYDATIDDTYRYWVVFEGVDQPADWSKWLYLLDTADPEISSIGELIETVEGVSRFKQSALAQVVRWVSGPVLPNEPYPPIRRLGTRDLTLFNGEDLPAIIPLEHLDSETLSVIEGEELRFVVETSRKVVLLSQLLEVENGSIQVPSTAQITTKKQSLQWALRWPITNAYITGGRITVAYAPINQQ